MSVASLTTLPGQPPSGTSRFQPLGGNGKQAPHSCYVVESDLVGDAGAGVASVQIQFDERYTNLLAWANCRIAVDAGAGDFALSLGHTSTDPEVVQVVGTIPQVATSVITSNAAFLWYPAPLYFRGDGFIQFRLPNVAATETYTLAVQIYCFDIDVVQLAPLGILQWNVPGVSAPVAV